MASKKEANANLEKARAVRELMKTGMSKTDARRAAGLDGGGQNHAPQTVRRKISPHQGESVMPTRSGGGITSGQTGALKAFVHAHTVLQYDERELGAILEGFVRAMREPVGPDTSSMFPPAMAPEAMVQWRELAQERELGRQILKHFGKAIVHFNITQDEWRVVFDRLVRDVYPDGRPVPFVQASPANSGVVRGVWLSPLTVPSVVTDSFNRVRDDGTVHKGVDLRAAVGTLVVAPRRGRIGKVGFDSEGGGGRFVQLVVERPDGTVPMDEFGVDDSGWRVSFAHLSDVIVKEGDVVEAGQAIARSGDTGYRQNGPHLHMSVQWFIDNKAINERVFVDPLAVIPEPVIKGEMQARPVQPGLMQVAPAIIESQPGSKDGQSVSVTIGGDGNLIFNNGTAVQVSPKVHIPMPFTGGGADDILAGRATDFFGPGAAPPVRPMSAQASAALSASQGGVGSALMGIPEQLLGMGGKVLEGVGNFAGKAFQMLTSPQGLRAAGNLVGGGAGLAGTAMALGGTVASTVGPMLVGWIPYVGPALATAAQVGGPIAAAVGPVLTGMGGAIKAASDVVGGGFDADFGMRQPPQLPAPVLPKPNNFDVEFFGIQPRKGSMSA